ncbi:MAG: T9SS type A sorting domain-containing protein, partial [bacterium]
GLTHERRIFFVKPEYWIISDLLTGSGSHKYDLYFHLDSPYLNHTTLSELDHSVATPNFIIMPSDIDAKAEIIAGWVSNSYNKKSEAPIVKYQKSGPPPITFETVLFPYDSGVIPLTVEKPVVFFEQNAVDPADAVSLKIQSGNWSDWFFHSTLSPGILSFGSFQCDARAAFIRIESDNLISNIQLVRGSLLYKGDTLLVDTDAEFADISWFQQSVFVEGEYVQHARIWAPQTDSVVVNGRKVSFVQNGNYVEFTITSIRDDELAAEILSGFRLEQNYPNPFNSSTSIRFILHKRDYVNLQIYDLLGHLVTTLIDRKMESGEHTIKWNGLDTHKRGLPSGIYFYRLKVGNKINTRRMLLLK